MSSRTSPSKPSDPSGLTTPISEVEDLIEEYLSFRSYPSLSSFVSDRTSCNTAAMLGGDLLHGDDGDDGENTASVLREFTQAFESGDHVDLFILWQNHIPRPLLRLNSTHPSSLAAMSLEFYLNLHCALYPFRDSFLSKCSSLDQVTEACGKSMSIFRRYIESRGSSLSQTPEFIAYYALPYIPSPTEHPTFKPIFKSGWTKNLKNTLLSFVESHIIATPQTIPKIFATVSSYNSAPSYSSINPSSSTDSNATQAALLTASTNREKKVTQFAQSIYNVSLELYDQLKHTRDKSSNHNHDYDDRLGDMLRGFQDTLDFLTKDQQDRTTSNSYNNSHNNSHKNNSHKNNSYKSRAANDYSAEPKDDGAGDFRISSPRSDAPIVNSMAQLDLEQIKEDVMSYAKSKNRDDWDTCAVLLQALRWRFSRAPSRTVLSNVLTSYARGDILGLLDDEGRDMFDVLLTHPSGIVKEYAARLVNTLTTMSAGRSYLLQAPDVSIPLLARTLMDQRSDTVLRKMTLGALQKCSLRKIAQVKMIECGVVDWIAGVLADHVEGTVVLQDYSLEYVTALLMNLSLRTTGKVAAAECKPDIVTTLADLMECDNTQVRHYVNGTVYSLLSRKNFRERAREMRLDETLSKIMKRATGEFARQAKFILDQIISSSPEGESDDEDDDDDGGSTSLQPDEIAEDAQLLENVANTNALSGEGLLCGNYLIREISSAQRNYEMDKDREAKTVSANSTAPMDMNNRARQHQQMSGDGDDDGFGTRAVTPSNNQSRRADRMEREESQAEMEAREELKKLQIAREKKKNAPKHSKVSKKTKKTSSTVAKRDKRDADDDAGEKKDDGADDDLDVEEDELDISNDPEASAAFQDRGRISRTPTKFDDEAEGGGEESYGDEADFENNSGEISD
jgi:hypothetical protein